MDRKDNVFCVSFGAGDYAMSWAFCVEAEQIESIAQNMPMFRFLARSEKFSEILSEELLRRIEASIPERSGVVFLQKKYSLRSGEIPAKAFNPRTDVSPVRHPERRRIGLAPDICSITAYSKQNRGAQWMLEAIDCVEASVALFKEEFGISGSNFLNGDRSNLFSDDTLYEAECLWLLTKLEESLLVNYSVQGTAGPKRTGSI